MESKLFHCLHLQPPDPPDAQGAHQEHPVSPRSLALCSAAEARELLTHERAVALQTLPLGLVEILGEKTLTIAVASGRAQESMAALRFSAGYAVRATELPAQIVEEAIFISYCGDEGRLARQRADLRDLEAGPELFEQGATPFRPETGEVGKFLASLIEYGFSKEASDIHLIPKASGTYARIRIKGELLDNPDSICPLALHRQLATRVKVLSGVDTANRHLPLDGSFAVPLAGRMAHVRVSTVPTVHGENIVLRLLGSGAALDLDGLEFGVELRTALDQVIRSPAGAVIVAGPTGSGKSSTLYALAAGAAANGRAVSTAEDPVERIVSGLSQSQVQESRGLTFPVCLRSIMRQDPDVIMIGEIRDSESATIATQAALTGHLLLSSVHAGTISGIVQRLVSLGIERTLIAETALLLINQRLLPVLCESCKVIELGESALRGRACYRPVGCRTCDYSGFSGRVPVAQAFLPTPSGRDLLRSGEPFSVMDGNPASYGWVGWEAQIERLLREGRITANAARAVTGG